MWDERRLAAPAPGKSLSFFYNTICGRILLKVLIQRFISCLAGVYMNSPLSRVMIKGWAEKNQIDISQYESEPFYCFNDFFTRKIKPDARSFDMKATSLIAPCDSKLTAYPLDQESTFFIKESPYTAESLVQDKALAEQYSGGFCLIFRLAVDDYHRYCYVDDGVKTDNAYIKGKLHTVQPIALKRYDVYKENSREYTLMYTKHFGKITQVEVGALLVGKIQNHHQAGDFQKGQEKGMFQFGGSTIVLLMEKNAVHLDQEILDNTQKGFETVVKIGERIGVAVPD